MGKQGKVGRGGRRGGCCGKPRAWQGGAPPPWAHLGRAVVVPHAAQHVAHTVPAGQAPPERNHRVGQEGAGTFTGGAHRCGNSCCWGGGASRCWPRRAWPGSPAAVDRTNTIGNKIQTTTKPLTGRGPACWTPPARSGAPPAWVQRATDTRSCIRADGNACRRHHQLVAAPRLFWEMGEAQAEMAAVRAEQEGRDP